MTTSAPTVAVAAPVSTAANSSSNTSSTNSSSSSNSNNTNNNTSTNNTNNNNNSSSGTGGSVSTGGATGGGTSSSGSVSGTTAAIGMSNGLHAALPATQQQQLLHHHQQQQQQQNHLQQPQQQPNLQQPHLQQPHLLPQHLPQPLPLSIPHPATAPQQQQQQQQQQTTRVMQSDEDFNIRFVNLVRTHKCLYDKKVPEYRNRDNQEKAWSLISQETRESVIHCKERWRNLRACLSRYIKQQSGSDPQHKPYYLTEHMAFLLPFLKSTRNSLDGNNCATLASLFQVHHHHHQHQQQQQQHQQHQHQHHRNSQAMQMITQPHLHFNGEQLEMKHSLSDIEDEETIDAFDPAVAATVQQMNSRRSPMSDTASANTLQNFIPDVQLAELRTPDGSAAEITFVTAQHNGHISDSGRRLGDGAHEPKRIKTEPLDGAHHGLHPMYGADNTDMEFFRSILPDIAALTPQQKRKFKIGILELIDDVIDRFPAEGHNGMTSSAASRSSRRNSAREWRK